MFGRAWVRVLLIATLTGYASRSRLKPFSPNSTECVTSIRLADCDLSSARRTAAPLPLLTVRAASK
jgi:hypothetical protein